MNIHESNEITVSDIEIKLENFEEPSSVYKPNAQIISNEFNGKKIIDEHFEELKSINPDEIYIKNEVQEEDQFNTNKINKREIKDEYFDVPEFIAHEDIIIKTDDQEEGQSNSKYLDPDYKDSRKTLMCKYCYAGLSTEVYKKTHESRCHLRKKEQQHWGGSAFECSYCKLLYTREVDKNKHQAVCRKKILKKYEEGRRKKGVRRYYCDKSSSESKQKSNLIDLHDKVNAPKYSCNHCSYETADNSRLKTHLRMHNCFGMICILCQKSFKQKVNLDAHYITRHPDKSDKWGSTITNKINECPTCIYKTVRVGDFKNHLATHETPTDQAQFKCKICSYKCARNSNFKKHLRIHVGQLPFVCTECDKRFSIKSQLDGHILSRHSENGELISTVTSKVHHCEKCAYKTVQNTHFKRHLKTCL